MAVTSATAFCRLKLPMIDHSRLENLLRDLVHIESVNPDLVRGGSGEEEIARHVAGALQRAGIPARVDEIAPRRANVVATLRGRREGRTLMLNGHLDTVGVEGMSEPFSGRLEDGCLYGRGAQDMKGGLAAALVAMETLAREGLEKGQVVLTAVADEECRSRGTRALLESGVRADAAIVLEPTAMELATAHKGFAWAEVETLGRAAHGSRPQEGRDAILHMGRVLAGIEELEQELCSRPVHPLLGRGSVHASLISGGQELSSYPAGCKLSLERRLLPDEDGFTFERELAQIITRLSRSNPSFQVRTVITYAAPALETPREAPIAQALFESARAVVGGRARFGGASFWTDAALLVAAGIPSVLFGPGGDGLHSTVEYVILEDVALVAEVLVKCVRAFCNA
jgi:acetylornithine deacetylase